MQRLADTATRFMDVLEESRHPVLRRSSGRIATEEERIVASWANLAIEQPYFTLGAARRFHQRDKDRAAASG